GRTDCRAERVGAGGSEADDGDEEPSVRRGRAPPGRGSTDCRAERGGAGGSEADDGDEEPSARTLAGDEGGGPGGGGDAGGVRLYAVEPRPAAGPTAAARAGLDHRPGHVHSGIGQSVGRFGGRVERGVVSR